MSNEGKHVCLEPLNIRHKEELCTAIKDGKLWKLWVTLVPHPDEIDDFFSFAQTSHQNGDGLSFAILNEGKVVGSTRFMRTCLSHKRTEIGFTFLAKSAQRTAVNTEAKLLMLTHAFEVLNLNRVDIITDVLNENSRRAILRLGAKEEGVLRSHMIMKDGRVRDSVVHSIIKEEWSDIKSKLKMKLERK
ncbi:GNAT family N-acetyltransferase [Sulfurimonas sp. MAG313]|nr:GNAT family protein [Sulfurimonas sp. MAG313]MDF1882305.1 GNAT family N-acetyltransferase [Sulfurimonas sp. MAG313]